METPACGSRCPGVLVRPAAVRDDGVVWEVARTECGELVGRFRAAASPTKGTGGEWAGMPGGRVCTANGTSSTVHVYHCAFPFALQLASLPIRTLRLAQVFPGCQLSTSACTQYGWQVHCVPWGTAGNYCRA